MNHQKMSALFSLSLLLFSSLAAFTWVFASGTSAVSHKPPVFIPLETESQNLQNSPARHWTSNLKTEHEIKVISAVIEKSGNLSRDLAANQNP